MKAVDVKLGQVFANAQQSVIPLFQRPYVWNLERNWQPLWDDVRIAAEDVERQSQSNGVKVSERTYFLGAIVLQTRPKDPGQVSLWNVVDGQQRLTTLQVLLSAIRAVASEREFQTVSNKFGSLIFNPPDVVHHKYPNDKYKVWPLPKDREAFIQAMELETATDSMLDNHKLVRAKKAFTEMVSSWMDESDEPEDRLLYLFDTLAEKMELVRIELESGDDPQVIFEVLNHRGQPLDAIDLIKNQLFRPLENASSIEQAEMLENKVWAPLDAEPWRDEVTAGRLKRKRADILMSYWLTSAKAGEVSIEHLFADFKEWHSTTDRTSDEIIQSIRDHADCMLDLRSRPLSTPIGGFVDRMEATQTNTPWPLILHMYLDDRIPENQREIAIRALDSFTMRRAICRYTTKDYNRLFLSVLSTIKQSDPERAGQILRDELLSQDADSRLWPSDEAFVKGLLAHNLFTAVIQARTKCLLLGIENSLISGKSDAVLRSAQDRTLNIEHVLPRSWEKHWPLPTHSSNPAHISPLEERNRAINSLGNLTILTTKLNPSLGNADWKTKKSKIQKQSVLLITHNSILSAPPDAEGNQEAWAEKWDEQRIAIRGEYLTELALDVWRRA